MRIYFYGSKTNRIDLDHYYSRIKRLLRQSGAELTSNTDHFESTLTRQDLAKIEAAGEIALDKMDSFVIEGTESDPQVGYLVAFAIARSKPTLYLYERRGQKQPLLNLLKGKSVPKTLNIVGYLKTNLDEKVQDFLKGREDLKVVEVPNIKFTLRITKTIEKYLHYRTHNTDKSKADFLREEIDAKMGKDEKFKKWLNKQSK